MKKLLAHVKTNAELTEYLASKTLEKGRQTGKCVVVAWSCCCEATHMHLKSLTFVIRVLGLYSRQTSFSIPAITRSVRCSVDPMSVSAVTLSSSAPTNAFQHRNFPFPGQRKTQFKTNTNNFFTCQVFCLPTKLPVTSAPLHA